MKKLYAITIEMDWTMEIREFDDQDHTRKVGAQRVKHQFVVVAPSEQIALAWAKEYYRYAGDPSQPKDYRVVSTWPVAGVLVEPDFHQTNELRGVA